jgi:hypothetical protein
MKTVIGGFTNISFVADRRQSAWRDLAAQRRPVCEGAKAAMGHWPQFSAIPDGNQFVLRLP